MRNYSGQHVSIHVNVPNEVERQATSIKAKTTDDMDITISLSEPLNAPVKGWIEVIGVPTGTNSIRNKEVNIFNARFAHYCEIQHFNESFRFFCHFLLDHHLSRRRFRTIQQRRLQSNGHILE